MGLGRLWKRRAALKPIGSSHARLLIPALRADADGKFGGSRGFIEHALDRGAGGFILFGGEAASVCELTRELRHRAGYPLLLASDLERGAGQQFAGATPLPPAAAIASLQDLSATGRAAEITAREARAVGIDLIFAPVADVDLEPLNPIVGTRAFGHDPSIVAAHTRAWVAGCREGGALSCAKHFPGHGRTSGDSHLERPVVTADRAMLEADLLPFRAAIAAGVDAMMTAHVAYPALDPSGSPATLSHPILTDLLRRELSFDGLVVTDALRMAGVTENLSEAEAAVRALAAGCDILLYPESLDAALEGLGRAISSGALDPRRVQSAVGRVARAVDRTSPVDTGEWGSADDRQWALRLALRSLVALKGQPSLRSTRVTLVEVDDDVHGMHSVPTRLTLPAALRAAGVELHGLGSPLVAVYSDVRAGKAAPGLSDRARERIGEVLTADPDATVVLFGHPRRAAELDSARHLLCAWGGEPLMQEAAAAWLAA